MFITDNPMWLAMRRTVEASLLEQDVAMLVAIALLAAAFVVFICTRRVTVACGLAIAAVVMPCGELSYMLNFSKSWLILASTMLGLTLLGGFRLVQSFDGWQGFSPHGRAYAATAFVAKLLGYVLAVLAVGLVWEYLEYRSFGNLLDVWLMCYYCAGLAAAVTRIEFNSGWKHQTSTSDQQPSNEPKLAQQA